MYVTWAPWSNAATSKAHRVRVEVFSKIRAMFLPLRCCSSRPATLSAFSDADRVSSPRHSRGVKSTSLRKFRPLRLFDMLGSLPLDWTGHASGAAATPPQLAAGHGHHLDPVVAQVRVTGDIAFIGHDHTRADRQHVAAIVPLLALCGVDILDRGEHPDGVQPQRRGNHLVHVLRGMLGDPELQLSIARLDSERGQHAQTLVLR